MARISLLILRRLGWTFVGERPEFSHYVALGAPHTSNLDVFFFMAVISRFDMPGRALAKHTLFRWPWAGLMRRMGLIPIRRDRQDGVVDQAIAALQRPEPMALVIAPEGTRARAQHWKSGFHRIALGAGVPIVAAFVDSETKTTGIAGVVQPTSDVAADMDKLRALYEGKGGLKPENASPIRLEIE